MKILIVTRNLPPLVGGMERLNWHMAAELAKKHELRIVGPQGSAAAAPAGVRVWEVPLRPLSRFLLFSWRHARRLARDWRPDIVLAGSGLTAPIARHAAGSTKAAVAVYVHGLDVALRHPIYRLLWRPAIRGADRVIANSSPTREICLAIGVSSDRIGIVHPGVRLPAGRYLDRNSGFRARHGFAERPIILSVGRLSVRKGLREFVELAMPSIVARYPDVLLLVVGDAPGDALHARAQTPESILAVAERVGVRSNLHFLGVISDYIELGEIYRAANVHVFPVRTIPGDPEGFGMVAVEAAAHGLPTVAFATGGVVDAVDDGRSGYKVRAGDYAGLSDAVLRVLADGAGSWTETATRFAQSFSWESFGRRIDAELAGLGQ